VAGSGNQHRTCRRHDQKFAPTISNAEDREGKKMSDIEIKLTNDPHHGDPNKETTSPFITTKGAKVPDGG
jgi:hypothetical protein